MDLPNDFDLADFTAYLRSAPADAAANRQAVVAILNEYKAGVLHEFRDEPAGVLKFIQLAVNEAEGLAWSTPYAHWMFPSLVEEKIQSSQRWAERQHRVSPGLHPAPTATSLLM
jgi:hypothetical protein